MPINFELIKNYTITEKKETLTEFERRRAEKEIEKLKEFTNKYKQ